MRSSDLTNASVRAAPRWAQGFAASLLQRKAPSQSHIAAQPVTDQLQVHSTRLDGLVMPPYPGAGIFYSALYGPDIASHRAGGGPTKQPGWMFDSM